MPVEPDLVAYLKSDATLTSLIDDNLYPEVAPVDAVAPYLVYSIQSTTHEMHLRGYAGLSYLTFLVESYAVEKSVVDQISKRLLALLNGFSGQWDGSTQVRACFVEDQSSQYNEPVDGSDVYLYSESFQFRACVADLYE